jgi:hypothetical protein
MFYWEALMIVAQSARVSAVDLTDERVIRGLLAPVPRIGASAILVTVAEQLTSDTPCSA